VIAERYFLCLAAGLGFVPITASLGNICTAAAQTYPSRPIIKDAGIGALGGAAVGALGGAAVKGGSGAGKGALLGGALGVGGGTLYGIWDNKKNDEHYRAAYGACMKSQGYAG